MVRTCQADEQLEKQFEGLLKRQAGPEVGLLIGRHATGGKVLLYGTIKTPSQEGLDPILVTGGAAAGAPATTSKGGKKGGVAGAGATGVVVTLETEWITEHVRQVVRMLPGGLAVLGLYVFCPDAAHSVALPQLCNLLSSLAPVCLPRHPTAAATPTPASATGAPSAPAPADGTPDHPLLLHIDASSRKQSLRALPAAPTGAPPSVAAVYALRPCELRFAPTLGSLVLLRCWHGLDLALPVAAGAAEAGAGVKKGGAEAGAGAGAGAGVGADLGPGASMRRLLAALVAAEAERIRRGVFVAPCGGQLLSDATPVAEALAGGGVGRDVASPAGAAAADNSLPLSIPVYDLTLLAPLPCEPSSAARTDVAQPGPSQAGAPGGGGGCVAGQARLRGALQGLAVVSKREAVGRAAAELKADLIASLTSRVELLAEEAAREAEAAEAEGQGEDPGVAPAHPLLQAAAGLAAAGGCDVVLPRRVVLPWLGGSLALCDYLVEGETAEVAAERARQLLGLELLGPGAGAGAQVGEAEQQQPATSAPSSALWQPNAVPAQAVSAPGAAAAAGWSSVAAPSLLGSCSLTVMASCAVAAVAGAVGLVSLSLAGGQAGGK